MLKSRSSMLERRRWLWHVLTSRSSRLERRRWLWDVLTIFGCMGALVGLWLPFWLTDQDHRRIWYVKEGALDLLLQVVPATIAAVFVFAAGAVFIMVQVIGPTLGSRAIEALLLRRRARACVIAGIVLLLACLALAALALIKEKGPPEVWEASAGSALALASLIYVPLSIWCISSVFHGFVSPAAYSRLLSRWPIGTGPVAADRAFHQIRALRQWLRTACGTGESRDIVFALKGFENLLGRYCDKARQGKGKGESLNKKLRQKNFPPEYSRSGEIANSRGRELLDPSRVSLNEGPQEGWFGDEFGRALARCAEVGIRSGALLRRDLDQFLEVIGGATLNLADFEPKHGKPRRPLHEEAEFLLNRIAEIGMYAFQYQDKPYNDWFVRPALVLASLESELEGIGSQVTGLPLYDSSSANGQRPPRQKHSLAGRSLAAWCLVNYTFQQQTKDSANPKGYPLAHGWRRLGEQARTKPYLWIEAKSLAKSPDMHPSWMPLDRDEPDAQQRLDTFLDDMQALVMQKPRGIPLEAWIFDFG